MLSGQLSSRACDSSSANSAKTLASPEGGLHPCHAPFCSRRQQPAHQFHSSRRTPVRALKPQLQLQHVQQHRLLPLPQQNSRAGGQTCCRAAAAAATAAAQTAAGPAVPAFLGLTVAAATLYTVACFVAMIVQPRRVRSAVQSQKIFIPLAVVYAILLAQSWTPDLLSTLLPGSLADGLQGGFNPQFFPRLAGICTLFSQIPTAPSVLVHIMTINLLMGRVAFLEGLRLRMPYVHTLLLSMVCGPLGLLSHYITQAVVAAVPSLRRREEPTVMYSDWGKITLDPYD